MHQSLKPKRPTFHSHVILLAQVDTISLSDDGYSWAQQYGLMLLLRDYRMRGAYIKAVL